MNIVHKEGEKEELRHTRVHKQDLNHLTTVTDRQSVDASVTVVVYETQWQRKKEQRKKAKKNKKKSMGVITLATTLMKIFHREKSV